jgi:YVTN family beta-propeller protein
MNLARRPALQVLFCLLLICVGCGETFRPVAVPVVPTPPNPKTFHFALVLSQNGPSANGASSEIDVSGDTVISQAAVGLQPIHVAVLPNISRVYVANAGVAPNLSDFVSAYAPTAAQTVATIALPPGAAPSFIYTTTNDAVWVANSGIGSVARILTGSNVVTHIIPVGADPVAETETPDGRKVYVVNRGDNTVSVIDTIDESVSATLPVGASPVWAASRSDSQRVYVLSQGSGTLSAIDALTDVVVGTVSLSPGANFVAYDSHMNRLYVSNPVSGTVTVLSAASDPPPVLATVPIAAGSPYQVAVLPDGSRAYVASTSVTGGQETAAVTVLNSSNNAVTKTLTMSPATATCDPSTRFPVSVAAGGDNSRVYLSDCSAGNTSIIRTLDDTFLLSIGAPVSALPSATVQISAASQNGAETTYTYVPTNSTPLQAGTTIQVTGMSDAGNNGSFLITALGSGTFTVANASGVTAFGQGGLGIAVKPPPQSPVFVLAGP